MAVSTYGWIPQIQELGCPDTVDTSGLMPTNPCMVLAFSCVRAKCLEQPRLTI